MIKSTKGKNELVDKDRIAIQNASVNRDSQELKMVQSSDYLSSFKDVFAIANCNKKKKNDIL